MTNLFHAARYASEIGRAPTVTVSINWHRLGVQEDNACSLFRDLRRRVRRRWKYLMESGVGFGPFDDLAVHENPSGKRNTHWSVRVPPAGLDEFKGTVERFLKKVVQIDDLGDGIFFQPIKALGGHMKYLGKGIRPDAAEYFYINAMDQGFVTGHGRTLVSRSLGLTERRRNGWKRKRRPS
jgi:hypothetical protein